MRGPILAAVILVSILGSLDLGASSFEKPDPKTLRDWRDKVCANCRAHDADGNSTSRIGGAQLVANKLAAPIACADPGTTAAWFVEEAEHLTAFLNSHGSHHK